EVARRVVEIIREIKPQVVITFNKYGGYGHPDHIAIQRATTDAFKLAGDATYVTDGQTPYQPQKLYYSSVAKLMTRYRIMRGRMNGEDPRRVGRNKDIDLQAIVDNAEPAHARVDIKPYLEIWDRASACHASQLGGGFGRFPMWLRKAAFSKQGFTRVYPAPQRN